MARELVVPWSRAKTYFGMSILSATEWFGGEALAAAPTVF